MYFFSHHMKLIALLLIWHVLSKSSGCHINDLETHLHKWISSFSGTHFVKHTSLPAWNTNGLSLSGFVPIVNVHTEMVISAVSWHCSSSTGVSGYKQPPLPLTWNQMSGHNVTRKLSVRHRLVSRYKLLTRVWKNSRTENSQ